MLGFMHAALLMNSAAGAAARKLRAARQTRHRILADDAGVIPDIAIQLGRLCGAGTRLQYSTPEDSALARMASPETATPIAATTAYAETPGQDMEG